MRFGRTSDLGLIAVRHESAPGDFEDAEWTYPEVGATRDDLPSGYAHLRRQTRIGGNGAASTREAIGGRRPTCRAGRRWVGVHREVRRYRCSGTPPHRGPKAP